MKRMKCVAAIFALLTLTALPSCAGRVAFKGSISINAAPEGPGFDPAMLIVRGNSGTLTVKNTLPKDHGFSIDGLNVEKVVHPGQTIKIDIKGLKPIDYEYFCQLHDLKTGKGKHRRGILRVGT